jgi:hypothetical protein
VQVAGAGGAQGARGGRQAPPHSSQAGGPQAGEQARALRATHAHAEPPAPPGCRTWCESMAMSGGMAPRWQILAL